MIPLLLSIICELWRKKAPGSSFRVVGINHATEGDVAGLFRFHFIALLIVVLQLSSAAVSAQGNISNEKIPFDIPRQRADLALIEFAEQADVTFIFPFDEARQKTANRVVGDYTRDEAIKILLETAGLEGSINQNGVLTVSVTGDGESGRLERGEEMNNEQGIFAKLAAILVAAATVPVSEPASAQAGAVLEEVLVTAQRRQQSLQEVPMSIEVTSGVQLQKLGYRDMEDLGKFSPTVVIDASKFLVPEMRIRGFGSSGGNLTLEQAAPIFLDEVYFGRPGQVQTAFLDVERVEVLKGPQPVFFGLNATAGAFNITSRGPTPEWEGYLDTEYANNQEAQLEFGVGGPITPTLGIRMAGKYEESGGFLRDIVTTDDIGEFEHLAGRIMLDWSPTNNFTVRLKFDGSAIDREDENWHICRTDGDLIFERNQEGVRFPDTQGNERSIYAEPPAGSGSPFPFDPISRDCLNTNQGIKATADKQVPGNVREANSNIGAIDIRNALDSWFRNAPQYLQETADRTGDGRMLPGNLTDVGFEGTTEIGFERMNTYNSYLSLEYDLANGMSVGWKNAIALQRRHNARDNTLTPFPINIQNRHVDYNQYSSEVRLRGRSAGYDLGAVTANFEVGAFWQNSDNTLHGNLPRANVRRGIRFNRLWEDQEWLNAFANLTIDFLDGQFSLDVGGRYSDVKKNSFISGWGANWVFDVTPCDSDNQDEFDPDACTADPDAVQIDQSETLFLLNSADTTNLWTTPFNTTRDTPSSWISGRTQAVGLSVPEFDVRNGPYRETFTENRFDPQVSLRWHPYSNHTIYARWAKAFKIGGFDTGVASIPRTVDDFIFDSEFSTNYEMGAKGTFWGGRAQYNLSLFNQEIKGLQVNVPTNDPDDPFVPENVGAQRTRGIEFHTSAAVTNRLIVGVTGAMMDAEFRFFPAAPCSAVEVAAAEQGTDIGGINPNCDLATSTIDRKGQQAPFAPDWKLVFNLNYTQPVSDTFNLELDLQGFFSDGYTTESATGEIPVVWEKHGDLNAILGFGPQDDTWRVSVFGRNLFEARPTYRPELDLLLDGIMAKEISANQFISYGIKFRYNYP